MNDYRILVVDDEEDLCEILKFNLEMEGYMVDTANSAEEALKLELPRYNLILLDVMLLFWYFIGVNPYFFSIRYSAKILAALSTL